MENNSKSYAAPPRQCDIVIIGAGLSGINAAYRIAQNLPQHPYIVLEASKAIGGTWHTFQYPGARPDSDIYTYSYPWFPWTHPSTVPDRDSMLQYLRAAAHSFGMHRHLYLNHQAITADWSSQRRQWQLQCRHHKKSIVLAARFVIYTTGIFSHSEARAVHIPGLVTFAGPIIHPQFWPEDVDYTDKRVILIGSGATAMTLLPVLSRTAQSVTLIQRSPGYLIPLPAHSTPGQRPVRLFRLKRIIWLLMLKAFFLLCSWCPGVMRWILITLVRWHLPAHMPVRPHFTPSYAPWVQRPNVCFGGDVFRALRNGKAHMETGEIEQVDSRGVALRSGRYIAGDLIVTATGPKLAFAGDVRISVDGREIRIGEQMAWNMVMVQNVPNSGFVMGYAHTSWTLGADARTWLICRVIEQIGLEGVVPRFKKTKGDDHQLALRTPIQLQSSYIKAQERCLPRVTDLGPWALRTTYLLDYLFARYGKIGDGLERV